VDAPRSPPLKFDSLTPEILVEVALALRKKDGTRPQESTYDQYRTAIRNLFFLYGTNWYIDFETKQSRLYKGLSRLARERIANGESKKGVDPLQFGDFKRLAASFLNSSKTEVIFSHAFLVLSWNLMCRASNCVGVCLEHIEWQNDDLSIWFSHSKCDQSGKRIQGMCMLTLSHLKYVQFYRLVYILIFSS
jgi:integrase